MKESGIKVKIDLTQFTPVFKKYPRESRKALEIVLFELYNLGKNMAIKECPVSNAWKAEYKGQGNYNIKRVRSGGLKLSLQRGKQGSIFNHDKAGLKIEFGSDLKYAPSIIDDTGPHKTGPIYPRTKKALMFVRKKSGGSKPIAKLFPAGDIFVTRGPTNPTHPGGKKITGKGGKALLHRVADHVEEQAPVILSQVLRKVGLI